MSFELPFTTISQFSLIHSNNWTVLVVLDACRFEALARIYSEYLDGTLYYCDSNASGTIEWLTRTWTGYYDLTYIAGNPTVGPKKSYRFEFSGRDHFKRVVPVWMQDWKKGTVPPEYVTDAYLKLRPHRAVLHYNQPHWPYVGETRLPDVPDLVNHKRGQWLVDNGLLPLWREAYDDNLRLVLHDLCRLPVDEKIVITADHGEVLGVHKSGVSFHTDGRTTIPELRVVPWLELSHP